MAHVYDRGQLWLRMVDKLLEGGAHTRGSKDIIQFADNLVSAYENRFAKEEPPSQGGTIVDLGELANQR
jgi:hypothetical protein